MIMSAGEQLMQEKSPVSNSVEMISFSLLTREMIIYLLQEMASRSEYTLHELNTRTKTRKLDHF
jgi:hypothetical protein